MGEFRERCLESEEEGGWHDETETVHGEVVVDTVKEEVEHESPVGIRKEVVDVEEESVESVFENSPDQVAGQEADGPLGESS